MLGWHGKIEKVPMDIQGTIVVTPHATRNNRIIQKRLGAFAHLLFELCTNLITDRMKYAM